MNADGVKTTPLSGEPDVLNGFSPEFDRVAQSAIENGYRQFLTRVATARKKTPEQVDAVAQGRVWAGGTARQLGLVDRSGNMNDALAEAAKRAGLKPDGWHAVYIEPPTSFTEYAASGLDAQAGTSKRTDGYICPCRMAAKPVHATRRG